MKIFLDKLSVGVGQRKFKVRVHDDALTGAEPGFEAVRVLTNKNTDLTGAATNTLHEYSDATLCDVDSVRHVYRSAANEDNDFKMPITQHQDFVQFHDYDFALTKEVSGTLSLELDKFKLFDRFQDFPNVLISYDSSKFGDINITAGMSEAEIYAELEKVFGTANDEGHDHATIDPSFINKEFKILHPNIAVAANADSLPFSYVLESNHAENQVVGSNGYVNVNPFRTKNHLKNDYNMFVDSSDQLVAWRRYTGIGRTGDEIWISYRVDHANSTTNEALTEQYETVEFLEGIAKYKGSSTGHKSNIYSIRIHNSGLNQEGEIYTELRNVFEKSLFTMMTKIAPMHTQLWKIEYIDE